MKNTVCSKCGKSATIVTEPSNLGTVYCKDCERTVGAQLAESPGNVKGSAATEPLAESASVALEPGSKDSRVKESEGTVFLSHLSVTRYATQRNWAFIGAICIGLLACPVFLQSFLLSSFFSKHHAFEFGGHFELLRNFGMLGMPPELLYLLGLSAVALICSLPAKRYYEPLLAFGILFCVVGILPARGVVKEGAQLWDWGQTDAEQFARSGPLVKLIVETMQVNGGGEVIGIAAFALVSSLLGMWIVRVRRVLANHRPELSVGSSYLECGSNRIVVVAANGAVLPPASMKPDPLNLTESPAGEISCTAYHPVIPPIIAFVLTGIIGGVVWTLVAFSRLPSEAGKIRYYESEKRQSFPRLRVRFATSKTIHLAGIPENEANVILNAIADQQRVTQ